MAKCPCGRECCSKKRLTSWLTTFISDAHAVMGHSTEHPPTMFLKKIRLARNAFFVNPQWLHLITSHRIFPETRHRWRYGSKKRPRKGPLISANILNNSSCLKAARAWASRSIDNALSRRPVRARLMDEPSKHISRLKYDGYSKHYYHFDRAACGQLFSLFKFKSRRTFLLFADVRQCAATQFLRKSCCVL